MEEHVGSLLADVSRLMRRSFDERARAIGVTRQQWQVLSTLARHEGINQGGLADLLDVEAITLCRMVDRLQDSDLVERRPDPADRRAWRLYMTDKARHLLDELRPLAHALQDDALTGFDDGARKTLIDALQAMRANLAKRPLVAGQTGELVHG